MPITRWEVFAIAVLAAVVTNTVIGVCYWYFTRMDSIGKD